MLASIGLSRPYPRPTVMDIRLIAVELIPMIDSITNRISYILLYQIENFCFLDL